MLLDRGADYEVQNNRGLSALHCAARAGHWELVEVVLERGAPLELPDRHQRTALMVAASEGHTGVTEMLLAKGASVGECKEKLF